MLFTVEISENKAEEIMEKISDSLNSKHSGSGMLVRKTEKFHSIVFWDKGFKVEFK